MRSIKLVVLLIILHSSITCSAATTSQQANLSENTFTQDKTSITLDSKQAEFAIKLKSNPTTGYTWFLREYNSEMLTPVSRTYQAGDTKLAGAPGYEIWTFRMKPNAFTVPQQTQIRFVYSRPWATQESPTQLTFRISTVGV